MYNYKDAATWSHKWTSSRTDCKKINISKYYTQFSCVIGYLAKIEVQVFYPQRCVQKTLDWHSKASFFCSSFCWPVAKRTTFLLRVKAARKLEQVCCACGFSRGKKRERMSKKNISSREFFQAKMATTAGVKKKRRQRHCNHVYARAVKNNNLGFIRRRKRESKHFFTSKFSPFSRARFN